MAEDKLNLASIAVFFSHAVYFSHTRPNLVAVSECETEQLCQALRLSPKDVQAHLRRNYDEIVSWVGQFIEAVPFETRSKPLYRDMIVPALASATWHRSISMSELVTGIYNHVVVRGDDNVFEAEKLRCVVSEISVAGVLDQKGRVLVTCDACLGKQHDDSPEGFMLGHAFVCRACVNEKRWWFVRSVARSGSRRQMCVMCHPQSHLYRTSLKEIEKSVKSTRRIGLSAVAEEKTIVFTIRVNKRTKIGVCAFHANLLELVAGHTLGVRRAPGQTGFEKTGKRARYAGPGKAGRRGSDRR